MACKHCGKGHKTSEHLKPSIPDKGFPTSEGKIYQRAHEAANKAEKKKYPKGFQQLKKLDQELGHKHELAGKNTKTGKIEVSKKVPPKLRAEVKYHEKVESKELKKRRKWIIACAANVWLAIPEYVINAGTNNMHEILKKIGKEVKAGKKMKAEKDVKKAIKKDVKLDKERDMLKKKSKMKGKC